MRKIILRNEIGILLTCFVVSRVLAAWLGITFQYGALFTYWQYLDVESLQHRALKSVWYMHSQPPVFNLLAALVLQSSGMYAKQVFQGLWLAISFCNAWLLLRMIKSMVVNSYLPLLIAIFYLLSPATILYENELFYTSFTSLLLLLSVFFLQQFVQRKERFSLPAFFVCMSMLCLTRSIYHLCWLVFVCMILLINNYKKPDFKKVVFGSVLSTLLVSGWYVKNYVLFGIFSVSSWTGINLSRIVFHDIPIHDSANIAAIHPFFPVSHYKRYISAGYREKYAGADDFVLLREMKNDSAINMNHAGYIQVSEKYMEASLRFIRQHPVAYIRHMVTSSVIFFSPASSYFQIEANNSKISLYDMIYSFNMSHVFVTKEDKKLALAVSAIPKCILYFSVIIFTLKRAFIRKYLPITSAYIICTILFVFIITTMFEYGENMRFRYELEPLFLIITAELLAVRLKLQ